MGFNMMARLRARRNKSPASVFFTSKGNENRKPQPCIMVACMVGGGKPVGPVWGHRKQSIDRALATLSKRCDCGAKFHQAQEFSGFRVGGD